MRAWRTAERRVVSLAAVLAFLRSAAPMGAYYAAFCSSRHDAPRVGGRMVRGTPSSVWRATVLTPQGARNVAGNEKNFRFARPMCGRKLASSGAAETAPGPRPIGEGGPGRLTARGTANRFCATSDDNIAAIELFSLLALSVTRTACSRASPVVVDRQRLSVGLPGGRRGRSAGCPRYQLMTWQRHKARKPRRRPKATGGHEVYGNKTLRKLLLGCSFGAAKENGPNCSLFNVERDS